MRAFFPGTLLETGERFTHRHPNAFLSRRGCAGICGYSVLYCQHAAFFSSLSRSSVELFVGEWVSVLMCLLSEQTSSHSNL